MTGRYASVDELRRGISTEILIAAGLPREGIHQRLLGPLVWPVAQRFARLAAGFDQLAAEDGLPAAARWALLQFVDEIRHINADKIPADSPLVIASNHPGSYDSLAILSAMPRNDTKLIVSDVPVLRGMHATSPHLIYVPKNPHVRMAALRASIRHLQTGGSLLVFASAQVDPDPALRSGASEELTKWSGSLPILLRRVPESRLVISIAREVVAPACYNHPLPRLRSEPRLRQFTAEFLQIGQQLLFGRRFQLAPTVRFSVPLVLDDLGNSESIQAAIISHARQVLEAGAGSDGDTVTVMR
jgi:hypothetical protein